jgi:DNA polymerase-3 subunit epsilon
MTAHWECPFDEAEFLFIDLEMTGLNPVEDRVLELHAERIRGNASRDEVGAARESWTTLIRPDCGRFGAAAIHGIREEELASAPGFAEIAPRLQGMLRSGILVGHGLHWDLRFLRQEFRRAGIDWKPPPYLDTLTLSRRAFAFQKYSLEALRENLGLPGGGHRAREDVRCVRALWSRILSELKPATARDLWHVRIGTGHARPEILEAITQAAGTGRTLRIHYRSARRAPEDVLFVVRAVHAHTEPARVVGYEASTHASRELRADRILAVDELVV